MAGVAGGATSGAISGATAGTAIAPGIGTAIGAGIGAIAGGIAGRKKQSRSQRQKQQLIDQLIASLTGEGQYASLFSASPEDFEKGFAEPARARFRNQTAPQIQQQYIASGQQRSTGLEDTLTRAGVDMDQLINEHYLQYQQGKESNAMNAINQILGQGDYGQNQSYGSAAMQGLAGYASDPRFGQDIGGIISSFNKPKIGQRATNAQAEETTPLSKGYES